jgi:deazaflavin-dependent oxidoreductase (nitroreductase family)
MDQREVNKKVIEQFREGGEIEGMHRDRLLLLTTMGRKSGSEHVTPMMLHWADGVLYVVASNNGADDDPDWYLNLLQDASVRVEIGDETFMAVASTIAGSQRNDVWKRILEEAPFFADHQAKVKREIPVVALSKVDDN